MLKPAEPMPLAEVAYKQIREAILNGDFQPGEVLKQDELARWLNVSRAPLREALPRLEAEGLVLLSPRRGYSVTHLEPSDIDELFELRSLLETYVISIAAQKRTPEDITHIREIMSLMSEKDMQTTEGFREWFHLHANLHDAFLAPAGLHHYLRVINDLQTIVEPYIRCEFRLTGNTTDAHEEHYALLTAFENGDASTCSSLMKSHIDHVAERLKGELTATVLKTVG